MIACLSTVNRDRSNKNEGAKRSSRRRWMRNLPWGNSCVALFQTTRIDYRVAHKDNTLLQSYVQLFPALRLILHGHTSWYTPPLVYTCCAQMTTGMIALGNVTELLKLWRAARSWPQDEMQEQFPKGQVKSKISNGETYGTMVLEM